ncbi:MAG: SGNH/GDSL hydrolase family protein [Gammaproteobacteria bacterium]|nr:SGNH/GDSL hydrolase family protein [Gammaproteobacteria bacterium]
MNRGRPARIIARNLGIAIALLVLVELTLGNWFRNDPLRPLAIPRDVSWRYEIDYPGIRDEDRAVRYVRDRYGLRGNYGLPADIDILTIGGSTTDQRFVTEGRTRQDVLMAEFGKAGLDIRVANAGINGRTTYGHLHDFDLWFPRIEGLAPAWVLLYVGINDMFAERATRFDSAHRRDESPWRHLRDNSVIFEARRTVSGMYRAGAVRTRRGDD